MYLILHYLKRCKTHVFFDTLAILGFATVELGAPTTVSRMIDNGIALNGRVYIYKMGAAILAVAIAEGIGNILLVYYSSQMSTRITRDIRNDIFRKAQEFSHTEYNKFRISSMVIRTTNDALTPVQLISIILRTALLTPTMIIISMFMVVHTSVTLSMTIGGCVPVICPDVYLVVRTNNPTSTKQQRGLGHLNRIARKSLTGVRMIHALCKDEYEAERFSDVNENYTKSIRKLFKLMLVAQPSLFLLLGLAVSIVFIPSNGLIDMGSLQMGSLVAFQGYMFRAMFSMMLFSLVFVMCPKAEISARRVKELLDEQPLIQDPRNPVLSEDEGGILAFDHIPFQYPDGEAPVLRDITLEVGRGDTVAFIGSTGNRKSTLANLIPRFYDISSGNIRIGNADMREYGLKALREKIGFISQKALLFTGNITENIRYGKHDTVRPEVERSAKMAQAYDFITEKPHQLDGMIEEGGGSVSGGQRQRLNIARAVVCKPGIYISDDSFFTLDFRTNTNLRKRLKEETEGATILTVAQRVTSIVDATKIIILNEGVVVGTGTHRELFKSCNIYHKIATSQLSGEELAQ